MKKHIRMMFTVIMALSVLDAVAGETVIRIKNQAVTLKADRVPLHVILKKMSEKGVIVKIDPEINPLITADFENKNIEDAFRQMTRGFNHAFIWKKGEKGGDPILSEVVIYRQGRMDSASRIKPSAALKIEKNPDTGAIYVKNKILIQFKKPVSSERIQAVLKRLNATIAGVHKRLGLYEITLPDNASMTEALEVLEREGGVVSAEPDYAYQSPDPVQYKDTGPVIQPEKIESHTDGSSPVAVLDSGLNPDFLSQDLNQASFNALAPEDGISDMAGHGTQMALIASGQVSPIGSENDTFSNPVVSIRAFDENGYTSNAVLIRSIDFAIEKGAKVLSLSWGSETDSRFLELAMTYAGSKGMVIVAAAGNSPTGKPVYPAAYDNVISVSALAPDGAAWDRSNFGDFVDISAPGFARLPIGHNGDPGTYAGTSISTAYIAGKLAAYLRKHPDARIKIKGGPLK